jgi:nitroreductase
MRKELILEILKERWSPYSFSSSPVEDFKIKAMLEAASYAPSCFNEQPWLFVYSTQKDSDVFNSFLDFLDESNKEWAKHAYILIVSMARLKFSKNGKLNRFAFYDTGMAVSNLLAQATALDVYVHQMGGFSIDKVRKYFRLSEDIEPVSVMAVGYLGDGLSFTEELLERDEIRRPRKPLTEYAFKNSMSNPAFFEEK